MSRSDYLHYGGGADAPDLRLEDTLAFLQGAGFVGGPLESARRGLLEAVHSPYVFEAVGANYCDFCYVKLMGGEYDQLQDGRERCIRCSKSVVRTKEHFEELFVTTRRLFELVFSTTIDVTMRVQMVNANEIAAQTGEVFTPTPGVDARVLGFATRNGKDYTLSIENGSPALAAVTTIAHELTHIWQFSNWEEGMVENVYGEEHKLAVMEGMATWAHVQYLMCIKEFEFADRQEAYAAQREDEYGEGFLIFRERYPLARSGVITGETPFQRKVPL